MRILEMAFAYIEGSSSQEVELKNLQAKLAASEKAQIKVERAWKLFEEESGRLSEECRVLLLEKKDLEEKVVVLTAKVTPAEDEPEDTQDLKTWAELVACFQLTVDNAQATSERSFENAVKHIHALNPMVELNTSSMGVNYYVDAGKILVPEYLKEFIA